MRFEFEWDSDIKCKVTEWQKDCIWCFLKHVPRLVSQVVVSQLSLLSFSLVSVCTPYCIIYCLPPICSGGVAVGVNVPKSLCIRLPQIHPPSSLGGSCALLWFRFPVTLSSFCFPVKHNLARRFRAGMCIECVLENVYFSRMPVEWLIPPAWNNLTYTGFTLVFNG